MKLLITGFEPFDKNPINPSHELVERLSDHAVDNVEILKAILPVDQDQAPDRLLSEINAHQPDAVLAFGLAAGRPKISLERVALNLMDFRIPDNAGKTVSDQPVVADGPAAYFTTLPINALAEALQNAGIPTEISLSAGAYLCNQVFYSMMHALSEQHLPTLAGFIHLPALPQQAAQLDKPMPSLPLEIDLQAAQIIIAQMELILLE